MLLFYILFSHWGDTSHLPSGLVPLFENRNKHRRISHNLSPILSFPPSYSLIKRRKKAERRRKGSRTGGVREEKGLMQKLFLFQNLLSSSLGPKSIFSNPWFIKSLVWWKFLFLPSLIFRVYDFLRALQWIKMYQLSMNSSWMWLWLCAAFLEKQGGNLRCWVTLSPCLAMSLSDFRAKYLQGVMTLTLN